MERFVRITGVAAPLLRADIDTDQIIPGPEIMHSSEDTPARWGAGLFANWRYLPGRRPNPDFVLNRAPFDRAVILLAERNFGCGSSREEAPKAVRGFGFRAVIAPSFGGIFYNNCFRNGVLPVELPSDAVHRIAASAEVTVDLESCAVSMSDGARVPFRVPPALRRMLLDGIDEIDQTLRRGDEIGAFRRRDRARRPWVYEPGLGR